MRVGFEAVLKETVVVVNGIKAQTLLKGTRGILKEVCRDVVTLLIDGVSYPDIPIQSVEQANHMNL